MVNEIFTIQQNYRKLRDFLYLLQKAQNLNENAA